MSRAKRRKLQIQPSRYQADVFALRTILRDDALPVELRTGNRQNDLLAAWKWLRRGA